MSVLLRSYYNSSRGGRAPDDVRQAFIEALDTLSHAEPEPTVELRGRQIPVRDVFGLLHNCSDILPSGVVSMLEHFDIELKGRRTYAAAARQLLAL